MSDLSNDARSVIEESNRDLPSEQDVERNLSKLHARLALPAAVAVIASSSPVAAASFGLSTKVWIGVAVAVFACVSGYGAIVVLGGRPSPSAPSAQVALASAGEAAERDDPGTEIPSPATAEAVAAESDTLDTSGIAPRRRARTRARSIEPVVPSAPVASATAPADPPPTVEPVDTRQELETIAAAQRLLRSGDARRALVLFDQVLGLQTRPRFEPEARAGRAIALCMMGRTSDGRAEVRRLEAEHGATPSLVRARAACEP